MDLRFWRKEQTALQAPKPHAAFSGVTLPPEMMQGMTAGGAIAARVSRGEALQVPAVLRARNLIAGTLGSLPVHIRDKDNKFAEPTRLLAQIDPDVPNAVTLTETYEDLLFEGVSWWRAIEWDGRDFPVHARHVPVESVHVAGRGGMPSVQSITADQNFPSNGQVFIDGRPVSDAVVMRFDSPNPPLLKHAARAIRTALRLDQTAAMYTNEPLPLGFLSPKDGVVEGTKAEVEELMNEWEEARRKRAWAYVGGGLDAKVLQWNAEQIQLADQRQHAVLEIARATGIDPEDLGVSTTSRTYQNSEDRRRALIDFTLKPYMTAVEQRLSMRDVLPSGFNAKVNLDSFLRSDTKTRMEAYEIGARVNAYTEDEIRDLEDRPRLEERRRVEVARDVQQEALNGAQIASLLSVMEQVALGMLHPDAAVLMLLISFPSLTEAQVRQLIAAAAKGRPQSEPTAPRNGNRAPVGAANNGR